MAELAVGLGPDESRVAAVIIGVPTFRLRSHYFVLASVFIVDAIHAVVSNTSALGAAIGIEYPLNRRVDFWSQLWTFQFQGSKLPYYYAALALFVLSVTVSWRIQNRPLGYYLRAIRDDQDAAQSLGIDVARYKLTALLISAVIVTLCGIFYAQYVLYIEPTATAMGFFWLAIGSLLAALVVLRRRRDRAKRAALESDARPEQAQLLDELGINE